MSFLQCDDEPQKQLNETCNFTTKDQARSNMNNQGFERQNVWWPNDGRSCYIVKHILIRQDFKQRCIMAVNIYWLVFSFWFFFWIFVPLKAREERALRAKRQLCDAAAVMDCRLNWTLTDSKCSQNWTSSSLDNYRNWRNMEVDRRQLSLFKIFSARSLSLSIKMTTLKNKSLYFCFKTTILLI